jgi:hypothetical protein
MSLPLSHRLHALADAYKETLAQIQELRNLSPTNSTSSDPDAHRLELATEIHGSLKEQEDALEILKQELDDDNVPNHRRHPSSRETDRERNADLVALLAEDLKTARANFRKAQLQAKRTADAEKRKEREQLFSDRKQDGHTQHRTRSTHEKLTQDDLAVRAAKDVTIALRRVHNQLQGELSTSQFAQQTLEESQQALKSLATSYAGTTDLLKTSRGFVSQLVRSNKSDTWFLKTSFYLLAATIAWLLYRRLLYGPMMLLIIWPLRTMWWVTLKSLGVVGLGGKSDAIAISTPVPTLSVSGPGANVGSMPTNPGGSQVYFKSMHLPAKGGGVRGQATQIPEHEVEDSMIDKIGRMMENQPDGTSEDDVSETKEQDDQPRNPKKRMMEVDVEPVRDEL